MKPDLQEKLNEILGWPFLKNVGKSEKAPVIVVPSWKVAFERRTEGKWDNCRLMARNRLQRLIEQHSWARSQEWNPLVDELRPLVRSVVPKAVEAACVPPQFAKCVVDSTVWDILGICLEFCYRDVIAAPFYIPHVESWYAKGRFPCGWTGEEFPEGWDGSFGDGQVIIY